MLERLKAFVADVRDTRIRFDPTINAIGLEELNDKGYINLPDSEFPIDPDFYSKLKAEIHETGAYIRHKRGADAIVFPIHPIFRPIKWKDVSREDYDLMIPSLKLASRLLDEPQILTYIKGFLGEPQTINDDVATRKEGQLLYTFDNAPLQDWASEYTWCIMSELRNNLTFEFSSQLPYECVAATGPGQTISTLAYGDTSTKSAKTFVDIQFLQVLQRNLPASQHSMPWTPGSHDESAVLRTQFAFAVTLVHEVMHALWITTNHTKEELSPIPPHYPQWVKREEPFFRDGRMNELGACWEDYVFGGMLHMLGKPTGAIMPYGISSVPFPGFSRNYPSSIDRENPRKWGIEWQTEYPIEMQHIRDMFTSEMWDEVHRYGIKRLRRKRKLGYRRYVDEKLFKALAPGEAVRGVAPSPTASVASMDGEEDDEKGVVRRG